MNTEESAKPVGDALEAATARLLNSMKTETPEARARRLKEGKDFADRRLQTQIRELTEQSRVPKRHLANVNLDRSGPWGDAERAIIDRLGKGVFIALIGVNGCGKSQLGVEAIRANAKKLKRSRFCTAMEFFVEVKASYSSDPDQRRSEKDVLRQFQTPALLVIDEIGKRSENDWENRLLFELLDKRYNDLKDTLVIANQTPEEFTKALGASLVSRIQETGGLVECNWPSYRATSK